MTMESPMGSTFRDRVTFRSHELEFGHLDTRHRALDVTQNANTSRVPAASPPSHT